jgi:hypothetical protein
VLDEILQEPVVSSRGRRTPRGVKRKISKFPVRRRPASPSTSVDIEKAIQIVK